MLVANKPISILNKFLNLLSVEVRILELPVLVASPKEEGLTSMRPINCGFPRLARSLTYPQMSCNIFLLYKGFWFGGIEFSRVFIALAFKLNK